MQSQSSPSSKHHTRPIPTTLRLELIIPLPAHNFSYSSKTNTTTISPHAPQNGEVSGAKSMLLGPHPLRLNPHLALTEQQWHKPLVLGSVFKSEQTPSR
uniref:Uncharacterized protein n=1 Tax=Knipowitschia caucasica TaxID=637954 RepID=A0AAV2JW34_KNICA